MEVHERRRIVLATVVTIVALPAVWLLDRDDPAPSPAVAAAGVPTPAAATESESDDTFVPEVPAFLDNTVVVPQPAVIDIAVPDSVNPNETEAMLTYKNYENIQVATPCSTVAAPSGARITVTNVDNGQSITCVNTLGMSIPIGSDMAIDINLYVKIADLVDAPIPVRISW